MWQYIYSFQETSQSIRTFSAFGERSAWFTASTMCGIKNLIFGLMLLFTTVSVYGDFQGGYAKVLDEYDNFKSTLEYFQTSLDDVCKELEEDEKFKFSLEKFVSSREELCKTRRIPTDCAKVKEEVPKAANGVYRIKPGDGKASFLAYCDMAEQEGGWLVIQRRQDGSEDFYRTWFEYMDGFGNLTGEFWLGNEKIQRLTNQGNYALRIDLQDALGRKSFAEYNHFRLANMSNFYTLSVSGFTGNATDRLTQHNHQRFSTWNLDLDDDSRNCAQLYRGAWWYKNCHYSNLNGLYGIDDTTGVYWKGTNRKTTMKIRLMP